MRRIMKIGAVLALATSPAAIPASAAAQQPPATLSLEEAVRLARSHNPLFRATANDENVADWEVAEAYGAFLPNLVVGSGINYQLEGTPRFGNFSGAELGLSRSPPQYFSSYDIQLGMQISGATLFDAARARASSRATEARIEAAGFTLDADVTSQYLDALQASDMVTLRRQELETADEAFKLAQGRVDAGAAPRLDVAQAEVSRGRAEVALLQAENDARAQRLALLQLLGVELDRDVVLTTQLSITEPAYDLDELLTWAMRSHPQLVSARATESAGRAASRAAKMSYLPTVSLGGGWSGFASRVGDREFVLARARSNAENRVTSCEMERALNERLSSPMPGFEPVDCSQFAFSDALGAEAVRANDISLFDFEQQPASFGLSVSLPIFDGFTRERQLQQSRALAEDTRELRRQEELNRRAEVINGYHDLLTAFRSVAIEERNAAAGAEQLQYAQERYRLNAGSILELNEAQETKAQADQARLAAIYAYHEALAELEAAVGRKLR
jgi:outer membrane protein